MAGAIFKEFPIDIHSGGVDLKFPHHDNEIAQSEAYYECDNWVNHFWHTGHLHIDGLKMSKSLKNFSTIKEMLQVYSARQVRFMFLLHSWSVTMNYSPDNSFPEAIAKEKQFNEFFKNIKATLRQCNIDKTEQKWNETDENLKAMLFAKQASVRAALCDSFDTPKAISELSELITLTNQYIAQPSNKIKIPLVKQISKFVFHIMKCFGIYEDGDFPAVGGAGEEQGTSYEDTITPLMNALAKFRDQVKHNANDGGKTLFQLCDELRDDVLPYLGI